MTPQFETRDAAGRRVSLLNDEEPRTSRPYPHLSSSFDSKTFQVPRTSSSTPATPELLRSSSYDSRMGTTEPVSPLTPLYEPGYRTFPQAQTECRSPYDDYYHEEAPVYAGVKRRPSSLSDGRSVSYEDDLIPGPVPAPPNAAPCPGGERSAKRFACRFRDTLGCEKTFTTSGHASRHAKIHTAEKGVHCSFEGCTKKFTRADNMKQHLETHFKEKPRSSHSRPAFLSDRRSSSSIKTLSWSSSGHSASSRSRAMTAAVAKTTTAGRSDRSIKGTSTSPTPGGAWDLRRLETDLQPRSPKVDTATIMPTKGLDTLATAALQQIGTPARP